MKLNDPDIKEKISGYKSNDLVSIECSHCNSIFLRKKINILGGLRKGNKKAYCSKQCESNSKNTSIETVCSQCGKKIVKVKSEFEKSVNHFCDHSCSAMFNNQGIKRNFSRGLVVKKRNVKKIIKLKIKSEKKLNYCSVCGKQNRPNKTYCSPQCYQKFDWEAKKKRIEKEPNLFSHRVLKKYLIEIRGYSCETCKNSQWLNQKIPLEMDHIDGNYENNQLNNLRLLCPNCHALTPTYKSKNIGKGRAKRKQRYKEGKSY